MGPVGDDAAQPSMKIRISERSAHAKPISEVQGVACMAPVRLAAAVRREPKASSNALMGTCWGRAVVSARVWRWYLLLSISDERESRQG